MGKAPGGAEPDERSRGEVRFRAAEVVHGGDVVAEAAGDPEAADDPTAGHGAGDRDGEVCRGDAGGDEGEGGDRDDLGGVVETAGEARGAGGEPVQAVHGGGEAAAGRAVRLAVLDGPGSDDRDRPRRRRRRAARHRPCDWVGDLDADAIRDPSGEEAERAGRGVGDHDAEHERDDDLRCQ
jgi:hypothetical protein